MCSTSSTSITQIRGEHGRVLRLHDVLDDDAGNIAVADLPDELNGLAHFARVQPCHDLVQQQQLRARGKRAGNFHCRFIASLAVFMIYSMSAPLAVADPSTFVLFF